MPPTNRSPYLRGTASGSNDRFDVHSRNMSDGPTIVNNNLIGMSDTWDFDSSDGPGMTHAKEIGARVKALRKARKEPQITTAVAIGVARGTYASIEAGFDTPGAQTLAALADYFAVSMDYLYFGKKDAPGRDGVADDPVMVEVIDWIRGMSKDERARLFLIIRAAITPLSSVTEA